MVLFVANDVVLAIVRNMILAPFEAVFNSIAHVVSSFLARSGTESQCFERCAHVFPISVVKDAEVLIEIGLRPTPRIRLA
jgi:hypothetical protein